MQDRLVKGYCIQEREAAAHLVNRIQTQTLYRNGFDLARGCELRQGLGIGSCCLLTTVGNWLRQEEGIPGKAEKLLVYKYVSMNTSGCLILKPLIFI